MSNILPLRGLLPKPELAEKVACLPYDVIDSFEARERAKDNPNSFLHVIKPEIDLDPSVDPYDISVYQKGRENLTRLINEKTLVISESPYFYVYKQVMGSHQQTGVVACASVDEYLNGRIKKHEHCQPAKVNDRLTLMQTLKAQTGPVFLTFRDQTGITELTRQAKQKKPVFNFTGDYAVQHIFYQVDDKDLIEKFKSAFAGIDYLYIADGHHRSETASLYCKLEREKNPGYAPDAPFNYFLTVIFPHTQMQILPYNRVVQNLNGLDVPAFMKKVKTGFDVETATRPFTQPGTMHKIGMYLQNLWYVLTPKANLVNLSHPIESLDVAILEKLLMDPVLGVKDQRTDKRMKFIGGFDSIKKIEKLVDAGDYAVGFSLYATTMEQIMKVADAGHVMPTKSTWFEPKLYSGLVTFLLE
ncbi:DUF1015 domain-containing protein [candidate division KSB1 bacterium]|nr:DUF1015 domain-containing protein [candidate division KSB1 bacterium]